LFLQKIEKGKATQKHKRDFSQEREHLSERDGEQGGVALKQKKKKKKKKKEEKIY